MKRQIDLLVEVSKILGADIKGIELSRIIKQAMKMDSEHRFNSEDGMAATLNYHTINMRSRFIKPQIKDRNISADWKTEPYFYRIEKGIYGLLSEEEKDLFKKAIEKEIELVYRDEFTLFQLKKVFQ